MGAGNIDWATAIGVLVVGLVFGTLLVLRMRAGGATTAEPASDSLEHRDLLGQRDVLLHQLVELEATSAKRSPEQLARERYALELDAARVLRELDRQPEGWTTDAAELPSPAPTATVDAPASAGRPALRGFLWGTGSMVALALLVFLVTEAARPREPGDSLTGELPTPPAPEAASLHEERLQAAVQRNPDDLDARLALAQSYLQRQDMMGVWNETQYVLGRSPGHPVALSYQALVRLAMGQPEMALEMLQQAIAAAPELPDPYVPLSIVQMRLGQNEAAARTMAEARRRFPERAEALTALEGELRASAGEGPATLEGNPHAGIAPPGAGGLAAGHPPLKAATAQPRRSVSGTVDLDGTLKSQGPSGVLFLIVRGAEVESGPPLAVQRLVPDSFPLRFEIGEADSMTGDSLPDELQVEARLDSDGDPSSRSATDPGAREDLVPLGSQDLQLVLRRGN